jgi:hypothetical protein
MKKGILSCMSLIFLAVLTGCATTTVYDQSIPKEKSAELKITSGLFVMHIDGNSFIKGRGTVVIPEGDHTFTFDYKSESQSGSTITTSRANGIAAEYTFKAGHTYTAVPIRNGQYGSFQF